MDLSKWNTQLAASGPYLSGMDRTIGNYTLYIRSNFILIKELFITTMPHRKIICEHYPSNCHNLADSVARGEKKWLTYVRKYCIIVCNTEFLA